MDQPQNERRGETISRSPLILSVYTPASALRSLSSVALSSETTRNVTHQSSINAWFDGSCWPNQGTFNHGGYGVIVKRAHEIVLSQSVFLGRGPHITSEVCEYAEVISAFHFLIAQQIQSATVYGDSQMVIEQLNGDAKVRGGLYVAHYRAALELRFKLPDIRLCWVSRKENREADKLSKAFRQTFL